MPGNCLDNNFPSSTPKGLRSLIEGETLSPFVTVSFFDATANGRLQPGITVGNRSAPGSGNTAVVKSFQYGSSDGAGCKVEIIDEEGGSFAKFADRLFTNVEKTSDTYRMKVQFGWVGARCTSGPNIKPEDTTSPILTFNPLGLNVEYLEGKIKFTLVGSDVLQIVFNTRGDKAWGTDDNPMPIKQAIQGLCRDIHPKFDVSFLRLSSSGGTTGASEWDFSIKKGQGPKSVWTYDGQNKISTISRWLEPYRTDADKGIKMVWDGDKVGETGTLILLEDPQPKCNELVGNDPNRSLGTYIVNGGKHSPVFSFQPNISWASGLAQLAGATGNAGGAATAAGKKKEDICDRQTRESGVAMSMAISRQAWDTIGKKDTLNEIDRSQQVHHRANMAMEAPIEAELRIQGDPRPEMVKAIIFAARTVSIIAINPFHITGGGQCGDWLAKPSCNPTLSSKHWWVMGVDHNITEGSYVTTLKLRLLVPEIDIPAGAPIGG